MIPLKDATSFIQTFTVILFSYWPISEREKLVYNGGIPNF